MTFINQIKWNKDGLVTVITQELKTKDILMLAWMNKEALLKTLSIQQAVYWSRSRQKLWHKGEESGHFQYVHDIRLDCDGDSLLLTVTQLEGIACHTGRHSCFFYQLHGLENLEQSPNNIFYQNDRQNLDNTGIIVHNDLKNVNEHEFFWDIIH
jgi:phosphoribosyl-AMP cyclohydrolase